MDACCCCSVRALPAASWKPRIQLKTSLFLYTRSSSRVFLNKRLRHTRRERCSALNKISTTFFQGDRNAKDENAVDIKQQLGEAFRVKEHTVDSQTPKGTLSPAAINAIEQFSRLNGLTGKKMKENFERCASVSVQNEAQNLLEFCCFRFLAKGSPDFNPILKDAAFRRLTFITMLGWQQPYMEDLKDGEELPSLVKEAAFLKIAPSIPGAADRATAHHLYDALVGDGDGLSFDRWDRYLYELCSVLSGREQFRQECTIKLDPDECPICFGADRRQPVQKWDNGVTWPGNLTMTDRALYFEPFRLILQKQQIFRLAFDGVHAKVERKKVGPFGVEIFDSAISVTSHSQSESWVLEFVDFSGKGRREVWYLYIQEMIAMYNFVRDYAPQTSDDSLQYVYVGKSGRRRAVNAALLGIARFQALQVTLKRPPPHPERLLQFSYLSNIPNGFLVLQTLAVDFWGGRMEPNSSQNSHNTNNTDAGYVVGTDGSIYLGKWMHSESWKTGESVAFWKQKSGVRGLVLGENHVVGGFSHLERAVQQCREQSKEIEMTKATIDGAIISGIPENIDLFKELMLPLQIFATELDKLRKWEQPPKTIAFLLCFLGLVYMNWLHYVLPTALLLSTTVILCLRGLRASGHLEPDFGKVTIKEPPPSNTIQKIMSLKEALAMVEEQLQKANVVLLKIRTLILSSSPKATNVALFCFIAAAAFLWMVPFRITLALLLLDQFTMELEFRKPMVRELLARIKTWWESIPATPVIVEPYEKSGESIALLPETPVIKTDMLVETLNQWFGENKD